MSRQVKIEETENLLKVVRVTDSKPLIEINRTDAPRLSLVERTLRNEGQTAAADRLAELVAAVQ